ncbi:MAG: hypothetical protein SFW08_12065 [Gemmatimonadaceae bacterium]|nr:hypothetical protein [Gemmatimonadaceae bacterium]
MHSLQSFSPSNLSPYVILPRPIRPLAVRQTLQALAAFVVATATAGEGAHAQSKKPAPTPAPPANAVPAFRVEFTAGADAPPEHSVIVQSTATGVVLWGNGVTERSTLRYATIAESRAFAQRIHAFVSLAMNEQCGLRSPGKVPPAPLVQQQLRTNVQRTFAMGCAIRASDRELVFAIADSAEEPVGRPRMPVAPWEAICSRFTVFVDSLVALHGTPAGATAPARLAGNCPKAYTAADLAELAVGLRRETNGDSLSTLLIGLGPRALSAVAADSLIGDLSPSARARVWRTIYGIAQQPLGEEADPDAVIVPFAQRLRAEPDRGIVDLVARSISALIVKNPSRVRSLDTLVAVLAERLPRLADRAKALTPSDIDKEVPETQSLVRHLDLVGELKAAAAPILPTLVGLVGKNGSATDLLLARAFRELGESASAADAAMLGLIASPTPHYSTPRTVVTYSEGQLVAMEAARALASLGPNGRKRIDSLWVAHNVPVVVEPGDIKEIKIDGLKLDPAPPALAADTVKPKADSAKPAPIAGPTTGAAGAPAAAGAAGAAGATPAPPPPPPIDTAALRIEREKARVARVWGSPEARGTLLDGEIRRQAIVAGLGAACSADAAVVEPLGTVAKEHISFVIPAPEDDPSAQLVKNRLLGERASTRVSAIEALAACGTKARSQLGIIGDLANARESDDTVPENVRRAAGVAIPKIRGDQ